MTRSLPPDQQQQPDEPGRPSPPGSGLTPTGLREVAVSVLCGAVLGWFAVSFFVVTSSPVAILPWSLPVLLGLVAVAVFVYSRVLRVKVADPHREVSPTEGIMSVALSKAVLLTGSVLVGACAVYVLHDVGHMSIPYPRMRVQRGSVTVVVCAGLAWAGWMLEKACRVPHDDGDHGKDGS